VLKDTVRIAERHALGNILLGICDLAVIDDDGISRGSRPIKPSNALGEGQIIIAREELAIL